MVKSFYKKYQAGGAGEDYRLCMYDIHSVCLILIVEKNIICINVNSEYTWYKVEVASMK